MGGIIQTIDKLAIPYILTLLALMNKIYEFYR